MNAVSAAIHLINADTYTALSGTLQSGWSVKSSLQHAVLGVRPRPSADMESLYRPPLNRPLYRLWSKGRSVVMSPTVGILQLECRHTTTSISKSKKWLNTQNPPSTNKAEKLRYCAIRFIPWQRSRQHALRPAVLLSSRPQAVTLFLTSIAIVLQAVAWLFSIAARREETVFMPPSKATDATTSTRGPSDSHG